MPWQPRANHTVLGNNTTPTWLLDSGTSHHVTSHLSNLSLHSPYQGYDDIMIGNGSTLPITHTGFNTIPTSSRTFTLQKVKDLNTRTIILMGEPKDGVYEWPTTFPFVTSSPLLAFSNVKTTSSEWHSRLDNGGEYQALDNFLSTNGIYHLTTPPHTPEHNDIEPHTINQAPTDPKWRQSMNDEFDALVRNGTWELVPSTSMQNLVGCHLSEDVYMAQPLGFVDRDNPTHVCKLKKAIYGLKQAPRAWRYISDLLARTKMSGAKPIASPLVTDGNLTLHSGTILTNYTEYRTLVGSLQYFCLTRPYISYAVNKLSQFMHRSTSEHWNAAKRLLRYLCGTLTHGLFLHKTNILSLHAFSNANWASNKDDYTFMSAYIVYLGHPRNNIQLLGHPQRPSIDQLPLLLQKSIGFVPFSQSLASLYLYRLLSIVTMLVPPIYVLIQSFIRINLLTLLLSRFQELRVKIGVSSGAPS
ncbi:Retrovirus-related Pol polyprotein from transposon RE2 [Vitis vinifera]|uniref:Retrovirus-related Pol polyprotein from transposon RE2 n=1 Tax=Vitis vinifera TaxID=29760 RepID=A0A438CA53_VITVI|nr:Retrovirus-related Pol polyprotein from transposon RE2 [Vitis vinifera]